jgi:hypothetical protein
MDFKRRLVLAIETIPNRMNITILGAIEAHKRQTKAQQEVVKRQKEERVRQDKLFRRLNEFALR